MDEVLSLEFEEFFKLVLKWWWCAILTFSFLPEAFNPQSLTVFSSITFWMIVQNTVVIVLVSTFSWALTKLHPIFRWSMLHLFMTDEEKAEEGSSDNIHIAPMFIKHFGIFFGALLILNIPRFARIEEEYFRGTAQSWWGWTEGIHMSFAFGMLHCLVGVSLGAGIAITIAGLWFTHQSFIGGVTLSTLHHTTYNLILVGGLFLLIVMSHITEKTKSKQILPDRHMQHHP